MQFSKIKLSFSDLTQTQQQRFPILNGFFGDEEAIIDIVTKIDSKGINSWKSVYGKITDMVRCNHVQQMYHDALYEAFDINRVYTPEDIIKTVSGVRFDMEMPAYLSSVKKNCEADFLALFIVDVQYKEAEPGQPENAAKVRRPIIGYKPLVRLKPIE